MPDMSEVHETGSYVSADIFEFVFCLIWEENWSLSKNDDSVYYHHLSVCLICNFLPKNRQLMFIIVLQSLNKAPF